MIIATSIIKNKPANVSTEEYINHLRNKLENEIYLNSVCDDDFLIDVDDNLMDTTQYYNNEIIEVTDAQCFPERYIIPNIHETTDKTIKRNVNDTDDKFELLQSDSINLHSDSEKVLQENYRNMHKIEDNKRPQVHNESNDETKRRSNFQNSSVQNTKKIDTQKFDYAKFQFNYKESSDKNSKLKIEVSKNSTKCNNNSLDLLKDYTFDTPYKTDRKHDFDVFKILREADDEIQDMQTLNTDKTFCESSHDTDTKNAISHTVINKHGRKSNTVDSIDSQKTEIYSVHGFTQNYTYFSQSQTQDVNIPQRYLYSTNNRNKENQVSINESIKSNDHDITMINDYDIFTQTQDYNEYKSHNISINLNNTTFNSNINAAINTDCNKEKAQEESANVEKFNTIYNKVEHESNKTKYMQDIIDANLFIEDREPNNDGFESVEMTKDTNGIDIDESKIHIDEVLKNSEPSNTQVNSHSNMIKYDTSECIKRDVHKLDLDDFITQDCIEFINNICQDDLNSTSKASQCERNTINEKPQTYDGQYIYLKNNSMTPNNFDENTISHNQFNSKIISSDFNADNTILQNNFYNENISLRNESKTNIIPEGKQNDFDALNMPPQNKTNATSGTLNNYRNIIPRNNYIDDDTFLQNGYYANVILPQNDCNHQNADLHTHINTAYISQNVFSASQDDLYADDIAKNDLNADNSTPNRYDANNFIKQNGISEMNGGEIQEINSDNKNVVQNNLNIEKMDVPEDESNEIVPFKIIEELNRIKGYLNRKIEIRQSRDASTTDSGRYSKSLSQLSASCLNQSAHCLLNYLTHCPLMTQTNDITIEISTVLGNLLDTLHEEENYPPFLEEFLDCISSLLNSLHREGKEDDTLLQKEELCQRLFLLNRSTHIQKHTIHTITDILIETHADLTRTDAKIEIENISRIENLCYLFHVLQIILPKFLKHREFFSQVSQKEERALTRSSLADIWRKRWSGDLKIKTDEQNVEKTDVLEKLSDILNRLTVFCMNGYTLVAYFSLRCFNLLQS